MDPAPASSSPLPDGDRVDIVVHHPTRTVDESRLETLVRDVVQGEALELRHVSIVCGDHDTVRQLNREYLDHDYNTDVLSFSLSDAEDVVEGEVYVDLDTASERHEEFGATFHEEVARYVVHGVLHLTGYDDATEPQKLHMRELEDVYLST